MSNGKAKILSEIPDLDYHEEAPKIDVNEFKKVIESRRSVRVYENEKIPDNVVQDCLRMATLAPSSSNLQPWEFYWVESAEKKSKLIKYCMDQPTAKTASTLIVCVARTQSWKQNRLKMLEILKSEDKAPKTAIEYYEKLIPLANGFTAPGISLIKRLGVTLAGLKGVTPRVPCSRAELLTWAHKSTALACENLMLAFRAYGYDTCPMEGMDKVRIKKLLQLAPDADVSMVISAGKRKAGGIYGPQIRFDQEMFIKKV